MGDANEFDPLEAEAGATTGYKTYGVEEEEPTPSEEEPEEEVDEVDEEESDDDEGGEGEPGDEEDELDEELLPKVSAELEEERQNLLRAFTGKTKEIAGLRIKSQLVDAIDQNPEATIPLLAKKYGIDLGGAAPAQEDEISFDFDPVEVTPKKEEELHEYVGRLTQANLKPVLDGIKKLLAQPKPKAKSKSASGDEGAVDINSVVSHLDGKYADWGLYEDRMVELIMKHKSLASDPDELYRLAKASAINISDAKRLKKVKKKKKAKSGERPGKVVKINVGKGKKLNFDQSWALAKQTLRGK